MVASSPQNVAPVLLRNKTQPQVKNPRKKLNPILLIAVLAMVLLAVSGFWRAYHHPAAGQWVKVVAAQHDIPAGVRLGFTSLRYLDIPKSFVTSDMVTSLNDVSDRVTRSFIPAGEPIRPFLLLPGHNGLALNLENHERAITLQLTDDALVDHSILPDDHVDLLVVSNKDGKKYTKTIGQDIRVLMSATKDQMLARHTASIANNKITLAVTPNLAEEITEAVETGKIRLLLCNRLCQPDKHLIGSQPSDLLPASASAEGSQQAFTSSVTALTPPPPPETNLLPPSLPVAAESSTPLQWMVEVISGNHKESYGVPEK